MRSSGERRQTEIGELPKLLGGFLRFRGSFPGVPIAAAVFTEAGTGAAPTVVNSGADQHQTFQ